ncbi:hypothetical protein ABTD43_19660, partial [Acinetobacter baumannii]
KKSEPILYDDDNILSRVVNTSGVILRIPELAGQDEGRYAIGHEIMTRYRRMRGIGPTDIDMTVTPIGVRENGFFIGLTDT